MTGWFWLGAWGGLVVLALLFGRQVRIYQDRRDVLAARARDAAFDAAVLQALTLAAHDPRCHCPGCCQALYSLPSPTTEHKP